MTVARMHRLVATVCIAALLAILVPLGAGAVQPTPDNDPGSPVGLTRAAVTYQLFDAVFNGGDAEAAALLVAADAEIRTTFGVFRGPDGLLDYIALVKRTYPDAIFDVTSVVVTIDGVDVGWTLTASRFLVAPDQRPVDMAVERAGTATFTIGESRVSSVTLADGEMILMSPDTEVATGDVEVATTTEITTMDCLVSCIP